jgi:hypothetical protein
MRKATLSQTHTKAGLGAIPRTFAALIWNAIVIMAVIPAQNFPYWFKAMFVVSGFLLALVAVNEWRQRVLGGVVRMQLSKDPMPHGIPVPVKFQIARRIQANTWQVEAKIESRSSNQSCFGLVWWQDYPAQAINRNHVHAEVILPSDCPSTAASDEDTQYYVALTLRANGLGWPFYVNTRSANSTESQLSLHTASKLGVSKRRWRRNY